MPLQKSKSKAAFKNNVATEVKAKEAEDYNPKKSAQIATAIAYNVKRKASGKKK